METSSVRPFKTAKGPLHGSVLSPCEDSVLRGWDPKVPVGSPVSFPKRSNPAWRLVAPSSPVLPRVELIQKVSTKTRKTKQLELTFVPGWWYGYLVKLSRQPGWVLQIKFLGTSTKVQYIYQKLQQVILRKSHCGQR